MISLDPGGAGCTHDHCCPHPFHSTCAASPPAIRPPTSVAPSSSFTRPSSARSRSTCSDAAASCSSSPLRSSLSASRSRRREARSLCRSPSCCRSVWWSRRTWDTWPSRGGESLGISGHQGGGRTWGYLAINGGGVGRGHQPVKREGGAAWAGTAGARACTAGA